MEKLLPRCAPTVGLWDQILLLDFVVFMQEKVAEWEGYDWYKDREGSKAPPLAGAIQIARGDWAC